MNEINCPKCGETAFLQHPARKIGTAAGVTVGGVMAYAGAVSTGAAVGGLIGGPLGALAGGMGGFFLSILLGASTGGIAGVKVGQLIDENVITAYKCPHCGHEFKI
jgi:predicted RNA-binding Zn-ribbon protein involved in translation (DUF1610 family)